MLPQPEAQKSQNLLLSWFVLIIGGLFLIPTLPFTLLLLLMPIWKPDEASFLSMMFTAFPAAFCAAAIWFMLRAYKTIRASMQEKPAYSKEQEIELPTATKKPIWPWLVIVPGAVCMIALGPGAMLLPVMPVYLAAMSTDSGTVPAYVPALIFILGYSLIIGYVILLVKAVKALRAK